MVGGSREPPKNKHSELFDVRGNSKLVCPTDEQHPKMAGWTSKKKKSRQSRASEHTNEARKNVV